MPIHSLFDSLFSCVLVVIIRKSRKTVAHFIILITGEHMCATGGKCYTEADRCDGRFDCDDHSDERDCPSKKTCSILL